MAADFPLPLVSRAEMYLDRQALLTDEGSFTYRQLLASSARAASCLLQGSTDLAEERVAYLIPPGFQHVAIQWGIWQAGGIAVPLALSSPRPELEYGIRDSGASIVVAHRQLMERLRPIAEDHGLRLLESHTALNGVSVPLPEVAPERRALILYTSGTTSKSKGVVTTHDNIRYQVTSLVKAWEWSPEDHILLVLPLHHTHGIINVLTCALWSGARCQTLPKFDAELVWDRILASDLSLLMAVPTVYAKLITAWEMASPGRRRALTSACSRLRLMVSGSAALPVQVLQRWKEISGHLLLERYGMTETGMLLSNPLHGERRPGFVGVPLPYVEVRLVDERGIAAPEGEAGEILVRGPGVFREYWRRPEATEQAFRQDWFATGDIAVMEEGSYRLLGRSSVDIIKSGGYKISALEIEEVLRSHPDISEVSIVGVTDEEWGERVCAAIVSPRGRTLDAESLRHWARDRLAPYKIPSRILQVEDLPRNVMGKVRKPAVRELFQPG